MKDYDIDYYRVDTVKHVDDTTWAALKNATTTANPSFKMIGEYSGAGYASNGNVLGTGEMDSILDFDFNDKATQFVSGELSAVEEFMSHRSEALNNTYLTGQFLSSHDEIGFKQNLIDNKSMTEEQANAASLVAATLQITAKGQPVIYYGEELGQTGENNYPYLTNRYDLDWSKATDSNKVYQHYKKLLHIRKNYMDVFAKGSRETLAVNDENGYDIVKRTYDNKSLLVGMNTKTDEQTVAIENCVANESYTDVYSGNTYQADDKGTLTVTLPANTEGGTVILVQTKDVVKDTTTTDSNDTKPDATGNASNTNGTKTDTTSKQDNTVVNSTENTGTGSSSTAKTTKKTPKKVKLVSAKKTGGRLTVKWKKLSGVTGYQIVISTKKSFTKAQKYKVTKASTVKKVIKNLSKNKKYYVKVRAYKKTKGKNVYGAYSKVIKTKK